MNIKGKYKQWAVYWAPLGVNDLGNETFDAPVEIRCRWENLQEEYTDYQGIVRISKSKVYEIEVLAPGGFLWEGRLADAETDPLAMPTASKIGAYNSVPSLRANQTLRWVTL